MEEPHDSSLEKICDIANIGCINMENGINGTDSQTTAESIKIQDKVKFTKTRKNLKSPQTNTIKNWLKKDSTSDSDIQPNLSSKLKNIGKLSSNVDDKINTGSKDVDKGQSSSSKVTIINKEKFVVKNSKKKKNVSRQGESARLHPNKERIKSKSNIKSRALQEVDIADGKTQSDGNIARKKFKNITSFTSSLDKKSKINPQTNIKSNEHESTSSSSFSSRRDNTKENAYVTPTKQNKSAEQLKKLPSEELKIKPRLKLVNMFSQYDEIKTSQSSCSRKDNTKENAVKITEQNSPESLRRSPRTVKPVRKLCDICSCDGTSSSHNKSREINKLECKSDCLRPNKSSKIHESSQDTQKNGIKGSKNNNYISKIKYKEKQVGENDGVVSSKSQTKPSVNLKPTTIVKSPKSSLDTSVPKKASSSSNGKVTWLTKDTGTSQHTKSSRSSKKHNSSNSKKEQKSSTKYNKLDVKINSKISTKARKKTLTLDNFVVKSPKGSSKRKLSRSESNDSCELPSFVKPDKKAKTSGGNDSFKKYGVAVPSVEEILKEQRDLAQYKNQVESFKDVDDKFFELPFSVEDLKVNETIETNLLDCKHLSDCEIEEAFYKNLDYISNIFHGTEYNERHERFFKDVVKSHAFTVKDLCYNTSTIVFSFEQKERILSLLKNEFDPDDKKTLYFFQVLLPELCLKIFMSTHNMTYDEAVKYLDKRPIVD